VGRPRAPAPDGIGALLRTLLGGRVGLVLLLLQQLRGRAARASGRGAEGCLRPRRASAFGGGGLGGRGRRPPRTPTLSCHAGAAGPRAARTGAREPRPGPAPRAKSCGEGAAEPVAVPYP
jgi:hypothetical protein